VLRTRLAVLVATLAAGAAFLPAGATARVQQGAAAGALPLVARHSGLAEVAGALESEVDRPGLFSFEPGDGAVPRIAAGIDRLLSIDADERARLAGAVSAFVGREWTWRRAAADLLDAAT